MRTGVKRSLKAPKKERGNICPGEKVHPWHNRDPCWGLKHCPGTTSLSQLFRA